MLKMLLRRSAGSTPSAADKPASSGSRLRFTSFTVLMLAFGLLLWARFLLVTSHPRTAYADPKPPQPAIERAAPSTTISTATPTPRP